jgi:PilZ domain-containing protein
MTLSSMVLSRDWQEISVLECILGGLHIGVEVVNEPERARSKLTKSKIDALIVDCDLDGTSSFLRGLRNGESRNSVPLVIVSGSSGRNSLEAKGASFIFEKPISVEQAVHTLSAARNIIVEGRLRYHREGLNAPVSLSCRSRNRMSAHLRNVSQGGIGIRLPRPAPLSGKVEAHFALPGTKRRMRVQGEIAWTGAEGNAGIRFVNMKPRAKRRLQLWLERQYFAR